MKKNFTLFVLLLIQSASLFSQVTTAFPCSATTPSYVIGFKNGTNCTVAPYSVYTTTLTGTLATTPLFTTLDSIEVQGIGMNAADSRGYAIWYKRRNSTTTPVTCINDTVKLIRFGANGAVEVLGYIPQPAGYVLNTTLGTMGADGRYYFGALINDQLAVGSIANVAALAAGTGALTATYRTVIYNCGGRSFGDWAFLPGTNTLYTYGISANINNQVEGVVMQIDLNAQTVNAVLNCNSATATTGTFFDAAQDNMGGIMFGADGNMYGVNVNTRRMYRISATTGAITLITTIPANGSGTPTISPMLADQGSCISSSTLPIGFSKFTVAPGGSCKAVLLWDVAGTENGDLFEVEKSYDGYSFFTLATSKAQTGVSNYTLTDAKPGITNYYRIKTASKTGEVKYSSVIRFLSECGGKNIITLFDNLLPGTTLNGEIYLAKTQSVSFTVLNAAGAKVFSKSAVTSAGVSKFNYNVPTLSKGVYFLHVVMGTESINEKFVVQ